MASVTRDDILDDALLAHIRREFKQVEHLNRALNAIRPQLTDYAPPLKIGQHLHICACGDYYVCSREADKCPVIEPFTCVGCAMEQQGQHLDAMEVADADHRER